jgi:hypothetical protein
MAAIITPTICFMILLIFVHKIAVLDLMGGLFAASLDSLRRRAAETQVSQTSKLSFSLAFKITHIKITTLQFS